MNKLGTGPGQWLAIIACAGMGMFSHNWYLMAYAGTAAILYHADATRTD